MRIKWTLRRARISRTANIVNNQMDAECRPSLVVASSIAHFMSLADTPTRLQRIIFSDIKISIQQSLIQLYFRKLCTHTDVLTG